MASPSCNSPIEKWLRDIDPALIRYTSDFIRLDFTSERSVKYFTAADFAQFLTPVSNAHRRMIINHVAKLQTPRSKLGLDTLNERALPNDDSKDKLKGLQPKSLDFSLNTACIDVSDDESDSAVSFSYKSPAEQALGELQDDIDLKQAEYNSARDYVQSLKSKYIQPSITDKCKSQCSKCHLRDGHNRRQCYNGDCPGPEYCNDIDKHPLERKTLQDAVHDMNNLEKELNSLRQHKKNKETALDETRNSFKYKIESTLINSNLEKYTFYTSRGRTPRQTVINNDIFILEKHYRGRIPLNLSEESKRFQKIISDFNKQFIPNPKTQAVNPEKKLLEKYGVIYPTCTGPSCSMSKDDNTMLFSVPPKKRKFLGKQEKL
ncbi:hypothetical protein FSP39_015453 [Pinctada imbricata]|uniref:Uncharacterized protein n=1 Tax=Pinctada imbricata TaxID=66713 RepID=A0AA88YAB7_PINIB|nr:hypothetical protein FSP39_000066 [Pinctada imbricata]KAK3102976.1 hypothetical protein FSP39_015453 [Pinctada imbricata]